MIWFDLIWFKWDDWSESLLSICNISTEGILHTCVRNSNSGLIGIEWNLIDLLWSDWTWFDSVEINWIIGIDLQRFIKGKFACLCPYIWMQVWFDLIRLDLVWNDLIWLDSVETNWIIGIDLQSFNKGTNA